MLGLLVSGLLLEIWEWESVFALNGALGLLVAVAATLASRHKIRPWRRHCWNRGPSDSSCGRGARLTASRSLR